MIRNGYEELRIIDSFLLVDVEWYLMDIKKYVIVMFPTFLIVFALFFILDNQYRYLLYLPIIIAWVIYYVWKFKGEKSSKNKQNLES